MKRFTLPIALIASLLAAPSAIAGPATDALTSCIADNSTGKDRKQLAQWIFVAMSAHPDIKRLSTVTAATREELDKALANLATKLLTESCSKEAKQAIATEGNKSFEAAFNVLGKLAMQELMADPGVTASFSNYTRYLDRSKFDAVLSSK